jgi:hypothetical protein
VARGRHLVVAAALLWPAVCVAQTAESNPWFVRVGATPSFILPTNPFSLNSAQAGDPIGWAPGVTVEVGRQTDGSKAWHELYNMPSYGFGISTASFQNRGEIVRPLEAYTFFSWPFGRLSDRLDLTSDFSVGVSWNWMPMNTSSSSSQTVLGSNLNARIDWGFYLRFLSTPHTVVYTGIDFTHRSNGGLVQPNQGINVLGPKVQMQYNFGPATQFFRETRPAPPFHPSWQSVIGGSLGVKNVIESTTPLVRRDFRVFEGMAELQRQFYTFGRIASGVDLTYDEASRYSSVGTYAGYEHIIGRFSALLHAGYVVARGIEAPDTPRFYQRYGLRYQLSRRAFTTLAVRAVEGRKADALQIGGGYRLR